MLVSHLFSSTLLSSSYKMGLLTYERNRLEHEILIMIDEQIELHEEMLRIWKAKRVTHRKVYKVEERSNKYMEVKKK